MVVKKGTEIVKGSNRKSIVPVPRKRAGDLAVRESRSPTVFQAIKQNEIAHAAEQLRKQNLERSKAEYLKKCEMFAHAKKGEWGPVFGWLEEKKYNNINERDECGRTLIMIAAIKGNVEVGKRLASVDAHLNLVDGLERSALIYAFRHEQPEFAKFLQSAGAKWENDLGVALRDRHLLLIKDMKGVLGISDEQSRSIEATLDPNRGPALSHRLQNLSDEAEAQQELTVMFQSERTTKAASPRGESKPESSTPKDNSKKNYHPGTFGC